MVGSPPAALIAVQIERLAGEIALLARPGTPAVQIDFDATRSQRAFYANILSEVRKQLSEDTRLSITTQLSCYGKAGPTLGCRIPPLRKTHMSLFAVQYKLFGYFLSRFSRSRFDGL